MIEARIIGRIKIPDLDFTNTLMEIAKKDITARMAKNIDKGIDLQEEEYSALAASTIKQKGGDKRPLIDTGRLRISWQIIRHGKNEVLVRIKAGRRKIAQYLQIDGIKTKTGKRFFNFFGMSSRMQTSGRRRMVKEIKKRIKNAG